MPRKRRRKLSAELEKEIAMIKKEVELITAMINDIDDEELQGEYREGFEPSRSACIYLSCEYEENGLTENSENWRDEYRLRLKKFKSEFEI